MKSAMMLDRKTQTGQSWQVGLKGQPGQEREDRIVETGELGTRAMEQDSYSRTGPAGQNREDKPGHDSNDKTAPSGELWTRLLGHDS
jgi:hypothetical protein